MVEFILARYNYWIVIILMMTGLYIVFSRGNLVKTIIGLNLFQTSVFIFYITVGKVAGGTAPIFVGGHDSGGHGDDSHGEGGHGDGHSAAYEGASGHGAEDHSDASHTQEALGHDDAAAYVSGEKANALDLNTPGASGNHSEAPASLHDMSEIEVSNSLSAQPAAPVNGHGADHDAHAAPILSVGEDGHGTAEHAGDMAHGAHDAVADVLYSNPLPHVLILTAIVVGVATTAVGLAIAIRIREAYGTIEEDQLERIDNEAATGSPDGEARSQ